MSKEALIYDTGEIPNSLVSAHLKRQMEQTGTRSEISPNLSRDTSAILLSFRSPQPGFLNSLLALKQAGIEILTDQRGETDPLIIAGGTAMINPFPMAPFMDAIYLGDASISTFQAINQASNPQGRKKDKLFQLQEAGFFVPSLDTKEKKPIFHSAENPDFAYVIGENQITHYNSPGSRRATTAYIEVKKGCGMRCSFCIDAQNPARTMPLIQYEKLVSKIIAKHPNLESLRLSFPALTRDNFLAFLDITTMLKEKNNAHFRINLGSTIPHQFDLQVAKKLAGLGQKVMTFAPEIAEGKIDGVNLRHTNKKWLTNRALYTAIERGLSADLTDLVLYHLTGFPGETDSHIQAFAKMSEEIVTRFPKLNKLSIISGPVFPLVGTKLENAPQIPFSEAQRRWELFRNLLAKQPKITPLWILNMPRGVRYNRTDAGADIYFCQAYYHRSNQRMAMALQTLNQKINKPKDIFTLGTKAHEQALRSAGIDIDSLFNAEDIVTSRRISFKKNLEIVSNLQK